jgi:hypothetical protein
VLLLLSVSVSIEVNQQQAGIVHTTATHWVKLVIDLHQHRLERLLHLEEVGMVLYLHLH